MLPLEGEDSKVGLEEAEAMGEEGLDLPMRCDEADRISAAAAEAREWAQRARTERPRRPHRHR